MWVVYDIEIGSFSHTSIATGPSCQSQCSHDHCSKVVCTESRLICIEDNNL